MSDNSEAYREENSHELCVIPIGSVCKRFITLDTT
jgi:hypothetical protein